MTMTPTTRKRGRPSGSLDGVRRTRRRARSEDGAPGTLPVHLQVVHDLVVEGLRNREISQRLGLERNTVRFYVSQIFKLRDVDSRTTLTVKHWKSWAEGEVARARRESRVG
jgi:DNA-binding NarL/FixJ family response regulator